MTFIGWGSSVATPSSLGADAQSPASSIKSEDYINQTSTASPATPSNPYQTYSPMHQKLQMESDKPVSSPQAGVGSSFVITSLPGHEILSVNEKRLCTNLKLTPAHYIRFEKYTYRFITALNLFSFGTIKKNDIIL